MTRDEPRRRAVGIGRPHWNARAHYPERRAAPCRRLGQGGESHDRAKTSRCAPTTGDSDGPRISPPKNSPSAQRSAAGSPRTCRRTSATRCTTRCACRATICSAGPRSSASRAGSAGAGRRSSAARAGTRSSSHLFEEECALAGAPRVVPFGPVMVAPVIMAFGTRRAAAALPARHHERRGLVEPGLQRAGLGLRPGVAQDQGRARAATTTSSTARRPGPRSASTATGSSAWCAPAAKASRRPASASC